LLLLFILASTCAFISIFYGSREIPFETTLQALTDFSAANIQHLIVQHLRLPRAILGVVVGLAIGCAGVLMQTLTRNPLADPGLLGVNSGATLAVVVAIAVFGLTEIHYYMWFSILGAMIAGTIIYLLSGLSQEVNPVRVVLSGIALSVVLLAITQIITVNSSESTFDQFRHWSVGSLQGRGFDVLYPILFLVCSGIALSMVLIKELNTVSLGRDIGQSLGINHTNVWLKCALAITILSGAATAAVGPLSFVGLTAPHIARFLVGSDHKWLLPYSMVISATMISIADILGKIIVAPDEISVGIMTALLGGPMFIFIIRKWKMSEL
jgi:iron complex transport system permease protein